MRTLRIALWAVAVAAALGAMLLAAGLMPGRDPASKLPLAASFGGPFELTDANGQRFSSKALAGKPYVIFFGFTNCPDICPTTLLDVTNSMRELGDKAADINFIFVSVDPERDTPEHLKVYLSNFDSRIVGLTGTPEEIAAMARAYRIIYERVPTSTGYTMNHTASLFMIDKSGRFFGTLSYQEPPATQLAKLKRLARG